MVRAAGERVIRRGGSGWKLRSAKPGEVGRFAASGRLTRRAGIPFARIHAGSKNAAQRRFTPLRCDVVLCKMRQLRHERVSERGITA